MLRLVVLSLLAVGAYSHLCLISPHQRGTMGGLNKPGSDDCALTNGPCGGREKMPPQIVIGAGEMINITFQKNLNHYNGAKPGHFEISFGPDEKTMQSLGATPDTNTTSPWLYEFSIEMPKVEQHEEGVLQVNYVTNNPNAPANFFQCADVAIMPHH